MSLRTNVKMMERCTKVLERVGAVVAMRSRSTTCFVRERKCLVGLGGKRREEDVSGRIQHNGRREKNWGEDALV